jgi:small GTP-binding protein
MDSENSVYKILMLGDSGVGKSCILNNIKGYEWSDYSTMTVGIDFIKKQIAKTQLIIWDSAGSSRFRSFKVISKVPMDLLLLLIHSMKIN